MNSWQIASVIIIKMESLKIRCDVGIRDFDVVLTGLSQNNRLLLLEEINKSYPTLVAMLLGGNLVISRVADLTNIENEDKNAKTKSQIAWENDLRLNKLGG